MKSKKSKTAAAKKSEKPSLLELRAWCNLLKNDREEEAKFLCLWEEEAYASVQGETRGSFAMRTIVLVAWADRHPDIVIDPSPLLRLMGALGKRSLGEPVDKKELERLLYEAHLPWQRLGIANTVRMQKEDLNPTERAVLEVLTEVRPRTLSLGDLAAKAGYKWGRVKNHLGPKSRLAKLGVRNVFGQGYCLPAATGVSPVTPSD
jgi:hypothetical protein